MSILIAALVALILAIPVAGFADTGEVEQLRACFQSGGTPEEQYSCFGLVVNQCREDGRSELLNCINDEIRVWQTLMDEQSARITFILQTEKITEGPCFENEDGCIQGLKNLLADGENYSAYQCAEEAKPENNAGFPEMAKAACLMTETARQAIRVRVFGSGMGEHVSK